MAGHGVSGFFSGDVLGDQIIPIKHAFNKLKVWPDGVKGLVSSVLGDIMQDTE
jgi:hypothetical protein